MKAACDLKPILRRAAKNALWLIVSEVLGKGSLVLANIFLARLLTSYGYGILALAQTWVLYAALAVDCGIGMYGQREAARRSERDELGKLADEIFTLKLTLGLLIFVPYSLLCWFLVSQRVVRLTDLSCGIYLIGYGASLDWLFRGREKYSVTLVVNVVSSAFFLVFLLLTVSGADTAPVAGLLWSGSCVLGSFLYLFYIPRLIGRPIRFCLSLPAWFVHGRDSAVFSVSAVFMQSYQFLPLVLLGWLTSKEILGFFAAPYRLIIQLGGLGFLLPMAFYPISTRLFVENPELFNESRRLLLFAMLICGLPIAIFGTITAVPIMITVFGPDFQESAAPFRIMVWLVPLFFIRYVYGSTMLSTGFQRLHLRASAVGFLTALSFGVLFGSYFGSVGVAASVLVSEAAIIVALGRFSRQVHFHLSFPTRSEMSRVVLLNILLGATGVWLNARVGWIPCLVFAGLGYPAGLWLLQVVNVHQISDLFLSKTRKHVSNEI